MNYYKEICLMAESYLKIVESQIPSEEKKELGEKALSLLGDYPLYSATSNITYDEAIAIALVLFGDLKRYKK